MKISRCYSEEQCSQSFVKVFSSQAAGLSWWYRKRSDNALTLLCHPWGDCNANRDKQALLSVLTDVLQEHALGLTLLGD